MDSFTYCALLSDFSIILTLLRRALEKKKTVSHVGEKIFEQLYLPKKRIPTIGSVRVINIHAFCSSFFLYCSYL